MVKKQERKCCQKQTKILPDKVRELSAKMGTLEERGILTDYVPIDASYTNFMWNTEFMLRYQQRRSPKLLKRLKNLDIGCGYSPENKEFVGIQKLIMEDISKDVVQAIENTALFPKDFTAKIKTYEDKLLRDPCTVISFNKGKTIKDPYEDKRFRVKYFNKRDRSEDGYGKIGFSHNTYCTDEKRFFGGVHQGQKIKITVRELATAYVLNITGRKVSLKVPNKFTIEPLKVVNSFIENFNQNGDLHNSLEKAVEAGRGEGK